MAMHEIFVGRNKAGSVFCDPGRKHVKHHDQVTWKVKQGSADVDNWAVVFGPTAPVRSKVLHGGDPTTDIEARRDFDPQKAKYVLLVWTKKGGVESCDPELIVDQ